MTTFADPHEAPQPHTILDSMTSPERPSLDKTLTDTGRLLADTAGMGQLWLSAGGGEPLPSATDIKRIISLCRSLIFPGFFGDTATTERNLPFLTGLRLEELHSLLTAQIAAGICFGDGTGCPPLGPLRARSEAIATEFIGRLPEVRALLMADAEATFRGDPAARSVNEVVFCYPGLKATANHRIAHELYRLEVPVVPRMISEMAHSETGIDIHPGAEIGSGLMIDHGTGVVIGATSIIGQRVRIYQGVTLGARSFPTDSNGDPIKGIPRHPIIGNDVVIYSNATLLGRITVGDGAVIGGNLWITADVAPGERILQPAPRIPQAK
ncbi:MAG: serine acetyltransferase [Pseudoflavonifractor sp.]|nr:serine acetyltransferase [Alloprevotella sp.]MCM1116985.1 serine acetyltransferase [Pseudoflavonifractor sp.]